MSVKEENILSRVVSTVLYETLLQQPCVWPWDNYFDQLSDVLVLKANSLHFLVNATKEWKAAV